MSGPRSPEAKAAKKFAENVGQMEFDPAVFAYFLYQQPFSIQQRAFDCFLAMVLLWSNEYDIVGDVDDLHLDARRLKDTIAAFTMDERL